MFTTGIRNEGPSTRPLDELPIINLKCCRQLRYRLRPMFATNLKCFGFLEQNF